MKKHILIIAVLFSCLSLTAHAQIGIGLSVNINTQPIWGPVGYDHADYYYMPDIETYYDINSRQYTYNEGGRWISTPALPPRYSSYDLYHGYKVVVNEPRPWMHHDKYKAQYAQYRGRHDQGVIRDSKEERYFANPGHPHHNEWQKSHGNDHGHEDHGHGHDDHDHGHDEHR